MMTCQPCFGFLHLWETVFLRDSARSYMLTPCDMRYENILHRQTSPVSPLTDISTAVLHKSAVRSNVELMSWKLCHQNIKYNLPRTTLCRNRNRVSCVIFDTGAGNVPRATSAKNEQFVNVCGGVYATSNRKPAT